LRCPSEVLSLKWESIDFAAGRMTVDSPKTERLDGKAFRVVPIFAALRPRLEEAFELAEPGDVYVIGGKTGGRYRAALLCPGGWNDSNMRTTFLKLVRRAGLTPWPKLLQNLRASCETDLMQHHPIHVVTAWVGNTPKIALAHCLQTLDADFVKAIRGEPGVAYSGAVGAELVRIPVQTRADTAGQGRTTPWSSRGNRRPCPVLAAPVRSGPPDEVGEAGIEPARPFRGNGF
jgi:hypothetical protein